MTACDCSQPVPRLSRRPPKPRPQRPTSRIEHKAYERYRQDPLSSVVEIKTPTRCAAHPMSEFSGKVIVGSMHTRISCQRGFILQIAKMNSRMRLSLAPIRIEIGISTELLLKSSRPILRYVNSKFALTRGKNKRPQS